MFPPAIRDGFAVVDNRVRFFAFDLPFDPPPFLTMSLVVGRLAVLPLDGTVVLDVVVGAGASVLVLVLVLVLDAVLPEAAPGLELVRSKGELVVTGCRRTVENIVVVSPI